MNDSIEFTFDGQLPLCSVRPKDDRMLEVFFRWPAENKREEPKEDLLELHAVSDRNIKAWQLEPAVRVKDEELMLATLVLEKPMAYEVTNLRVGDSHIVIVKLRTV